MVPNLFSRTATFVRIALLAFVLLTTSSASGQDDNGAVRPSTPIETSGELTMEDDTLSTGQHVDLLNFNVPAGSWLEALVASTDFDTYLILIQPDGTDLHSDDHAGSLSQSWLETEVDDAGVWTALVTSANPGETGAYTLSTVVYPERPDEPLLVESRSSEGTSLRIDETDGTAGLPADVRTGTLNSEDHTLDSGEYYDQFVYKLTAGQLLTAILTSDDFDPYLIVSSADGTSRDYNDDYNGSLQESRIEMRVPDSGSWSVLVTTSTEGESGRYELSVSVSND